MMEEQKKKILEHLNSLIEKGMTGADALAEEIPNIGKAYLDYRVTENIACIVLVGFIITAILIAWTWGTRKALKKAKCADGSLDSEWVGPIAACWCIPIIILICAGKEGVWDPAMEALHATKSPITFLAKEIRRF